MTFDEFKNILKYPFHEYQFFYEEFHDIKASLVFDGKWQILPNELIVNDKSFHLEKMLMNEPHIDDLLSLLPTNHSFSVIYQISDLYEEDVYPFLEKGNTVIKIIAEYENNKVVEPFINLTNCVLSLYPDSLDDLWKTFCKLSAVASGFSGIRWFHLNSGDHGEFITDSYKDLMMLLSLPKNYMSDDDSMKKFSIIFNMIKRQEATSLHEVFPQYVDTVDYVMNTILKKVFGYFMDILNENIPEDSKNISVLSTMPTVIKTWLSNTLDIKTESKRTDSVILWRELVELDIDFCDIIAAYKLI